MFVLLKCPNPACLYHNAPDSSRFRKKGTYTTKHDSQKVPRYQCKNCLTLFSSKTILGTANQKRPELNEEIYRLYCSGMTIRRMSRLLKCSRTTIQNKICFLAIKARQYHEDFLAYGLLQTGEVSFDEMETFEHTKLKPLSIAIAVCVESGKIIDMEVAEMNSKGHIAKVSQFLYGWRVDNRPAACEDVVRSVKKCVGVNAKIVSDGKLHYRTLFKKFLPNCRHVWVDTRSVKDAPLSEQAAIQILNHRCALLRADMSRLRRKTWTTTKDPEMLKAHLDLLISWINGYPIRDVINGKSPARLVA